MKAMDFPLAAALLCLPLLGGGCANHLRDLDTMSQEDDKRVLNVKYELKLSPETIRETSYHVEIQKLESVDIKKFQVRTVKSVVTPYQGWRELYEVPAGIGLLPVAIGSHFLFICSFGILPYDIPKSLTASSFTGMNPALNWESEERSEENLVLLDRKMLSHTTENIRTPLAQQEISVRAGKQSRKFRTDDFGGFDLHFLALNPADAFFPTARKISFVAETAPGRELRHIILTRDFLARLLWARAKIDAYRINASGKELFDTVIYLEKNGFEQLAYALEESELKKMEKNAKFQEDFRTAAQK